MIVRELVAKKGGMLSIRTGEPGNVARDEGCRWLRQQENALQSMRGEVNVLHGEEAGQPARR